MWFHPDPWSNCSLNQSQYKMSQDYIRHLYYGTRGTGVSNLFSLLKILFGSLKCRVKKRMVFTKLHVPTLRKTDS